jgi:hypothetical protein
MPMADAKRPIHRGFAKRKQCGHSSALARCAADASWPHNVTLWRVLPAFERVRKFPMFYSRNCGAEFVKSAYAQDVKLLSAVATLSLCSAATTLAAVTDVTSRTTVTLKPGQNLIITWALPPAYSSDPNLSIDIIGFSLVGEAIPGADPNCGEIDSGSCDAPAQYAFQCSVVTPVANSPFPCRVIGAQYSMNGSITGSVRGFQYSVNVSHADAIRSVGGGEIKLTNTGVADYTFGPPPPASNSWEFPNLYITPQPKDGSIGRSFAVVQGVLLDDAVPDRTSFFFTPDANSKLIYCRSLASVSSNQDWMWSSYRVLGTACDTLVH